MACFNISREFLESKAAAGDSRLVVEKLPAI